ncbi:MULTISPECIES: hypothetical protein [Vibrio]|uniref:hypothetical protein n=1 Tax=Vibrio TaxID=662 RepID=UPI00097E276A|nr:MULTISPECIES: hypothetical protein [Vibrio]AQM21323.1 hypothetical protein PN51_16070 [Vibrio anguillarum]AUB86310.1 hypothetical protein CKY00_03075 [Vibrio anguillarum]AUB89748.1 hypothetical protein CKX99_03075 [Vibrio anguillarum]AUB93190.1 hypothetical protein CK210_03075 [Vibrio anguillarum]AUB96622.1 hypothetical protein CK209_03075 [Vibrio anguillarum]
MAHLAYLLRNLSLSSKFHHQRMKGTIMMTTFSYSRSLRNLLLSVGLLLSITAVQANPSDALIMQYNQAAEGDSDKVELVLHQLEQLIKQQGAKPLSLAYLGSAQTLQGRDAFMPWNKMRYVEEGLATIDKGLTLLSNHPQPLAEQERVMGLPDSYLTRAVSAATYTSLPDMFNHFERGYDLYLDLLVEPELTAQPFAATAWVYRYAIQAALRANDIPQAEQWLAQMQTHQKQGKQVDNQPAEHPQIIQAKALITNALIENGLTEKTHELKSE